MAMITKALMAVLIAVIVVGCLWFLSQKDRCGVKFADATYNPSYCDTSCNVDTDCAYSCGCGAINKNEVCNAEGIMYDCVNHEVKCTLHKCVLGPESIPSVKVSTDKTEYVQGETIKITARNDLNVPILYSGWGGRFWELEYFENNTWTNPAYEKGGGFQLAKGNVNDACYIIFYERGYPIILDARANASQEWNQKICPFENGQNPSKPSFVKYIGAGRYRLIFNYGFEASGNDSFKIADIKTVYSDEFTIQ